MTVDLGPRVELPERFPPHGGMPVRDGNPQGGPAGGPLRRQACSTRTSRMPSTGDSSSPPSPDSLAVTTPCAMEHCRYREWGGSCEAFAVDGDVDSLVLPTDAAVSQGGYALDVDVSRHASLTRALRRAKYMRDPDYEPRCTRPRTPEARSGLSESVNLKRQLRAWLICAPFKPKHDLFRTPRAFWFGRRPCAENDVRWMSGLLRWAECVHSENGMLQPASRQLFGRDRELAVLTPRPRRQRGGRARSRLDWRGTGYRKDAACRRARGRRRNAQRSRGHAASTRKWRRRIGRGPKVIRALLRTATLEELQLPDVVSRASQRAGSGPCTSSSDDSSVSCAERRRPTAINCSTPFARCYSAPPHAQWSWSFSTTCTKPTRAPCYCWNSSLASSPTAGSCSSPRTGPTKCRGA